MAAYRDLASRAAALGAGLVYQGQPAGWLVRAARAATATPIVVNVKGIDADSTPVMVSLAELERLHRLAALVDDMAVLMPDALGIPAGLGQAAGE